MTVTEPIHQHNQTKLQRRLEIERRRVLVSALLLSGLNYSQIIDSLARQGISASKATISNDVTEIRRAWRDRFTETYMAHASEQLALLDAMKRALVPKVLDPSKPNLWAVDRVLGILDREAKLLGLDAPSKVEVSLKIEAIFVALQGTLAELGVDANTGRQILATKLRELEAVPTALSS